MKPLQCTPGSAPDSAPGGWGWVGMDSTGRDEKESAELLATLYGQVLWSVPDLMLFVLVIAPLRLEPGAGVCVPGGSRQGGGGADDRNGSAGALWTVLSLPGSIGRVPTVAAASPNQRRF